MPHKLFHSVLQHRTHLVDSPINLVTHVLLSIAFILQLQIFAALVS